MFIYLCQVDAMKRRLKIKVNMVFISTLDQVNKLISDAKIKVNNLNEDDISIKESDNEAVRYFSLQSWDSKGEAYLHFYIEFYKENKCLLDCIVRTKSHNLYNCIDYGLAEALINSL